MNPARPPARGAARLVRSLVLLGLVLGLLPWSLSVPPAIARAPNEALAADGTPAAGRTVVILADRARPPAAPSGEQVLRLAGPVIDPPTLDPARVRDASTAFLVRQIFAGLTRFDDALNPVPDLADRIEISADGRRYTFRLAEGAAFADGRPILAADVVASLTRALRPADGLPPGDLAGLAFLGDIEGADAVAAGDATVLIGAEAVDERTVRLRLTAPRATFLMKLAAPQAAIVDPRDPERGAEWWRSPNATGPFVVAAWEPEVALTLAANDRAVAGRPLLDRIEIRLGPGAAQPENLYEAGQIDLVAVPVSAIDRVLDPRARLEAEVVETPLFATEYIAFRADVPPLDDPHVRRALRLAFPSDRIAEVTFGGRKLAARGLIPPGMLGRDWPGPSAPYDPDAAREELAASRYGAAEAIPPIRIYAANPFGAEALRDVLAEELGLRIEVVAVEWETFIGGLARREFPAYELLWIADYPDPETFLGSLFGSGSPDNYSNFRDARYDALLATAAATLDPDRRAALYARAHDYLLSQAVVLPLYHDVRYTLVRPDVEGLVVTPLGLLALDGVWLERG